MNLAMDILNDYFYLIPAALLLIIGLVILRYERINRKKTKTMNEEFDHLKDMIENGYMEADGNPLKCIKCDSTVYKDKNIDVSEHGVNEFKRICECGHIMGYWSYGCWQL